MGKTILQKILEGAGYVRDTEYRGPNITYVRFDDITKKLNAERFFLTQDQSKCFRQYTDVVLTSYELTKAYPELFEKRCGNVENKNVTIRDVLKYAGFALTDCSQKDWIQGGIDEIYSKSELSQVDISHPSSYMFYVGRDNSCWSYDGKCIIKEYDIPSFIKTFPQFFSERLGKSDDEFVKTVLHNAKNTDYTESIGEKCVRKGCLSIIWGSAIIYLIFACVLIMFIAWPILQLLLKIITAPLGIFLSDDLYGNPAGPVEWIFGILAVIWTAVVIIAFFKSIFSK